MLEFVLALLVFLAAHVVPGRTELRAALVARAGERRYLLGYSLLSLALLAWLISAAIQAPVVSLWTTSLDHYWFALVLMLPASMLLVGGVASPNPLSVSFSAAGYDPAAPGLIGVTRHPLLWGFLLWALAHVLPNGELVPLVMFGGGLFALAGMVVIDRRKRRQHGDEWERLASSTSVLPFAAWFRDPMARRWRPGAAVMTLAGGTGLYLLLLWLHPRIIGPDPGAMLL